MGTYRDTNAQHFWLIVGDGNKVEKHIEEEMETAVL